MGKFLKNLYKLQLTYLRNKSLKDEIKDNERLTLDLLSNYKSSDTIFIFGSSPSLNFLSDNDFRNFNKHDIFGVNGSLFLDIKPTFYWYECSKHKILDYLKFNEIEHRKEYFKDVPFVLNFSNFKGFQFSKNDLPKVIKDNTKFFIDHKLPNYSKENISKFYKKLLKNKDNLNYLPFPHIRGSIATCILISWALGYKNIILPGVDLNNQDYFFYNKQGNGEYIKSVLEVINKYENNFDNSKGHRTIREDVGQQYKMPSVIEVIKLMNDEILIPDNVSLYAFSAQSLLSKILPIYKSKV